MSYKSQCNSLFMFGYVFSFFVQSLKCFHVYVKKNTHGPLSSTNTNVRWQQSIIRQRHKQASNKQNKEKRYLNFQSINKQLKMYLVTVGHSVSEYPIIYLLNSKEYLNVMLVCIFATAIRTATGSVCAKSYKSVVGMPRSLLTRRPVYLFSFQTFRAFTDRRKVG